MSKRFSALMLAILAARPASGGGGGITIVQTQHVINNTAAASQTFSFASPTSAGSAIIFVGYLSNDVTAASSITLSYSDDHSSSGWTADISNDPGGGSGKKAFVGSCLTAATGVSAVTITFTGGSMQIEGALIEVAGLTSRGSSATYSSGGSTIASPLTNTNSAANTTVNALAVHACVVDLFSNTIGLSAAPGTGTFVQLALNNQAQPGSSHLAIGIAGYTKDTSTITDSITDTWTGGNSSACAVLKTFLS